MPREINIIRDKEGFKYDIPIIMNIIIKTALTISTIDEKRADAIEFALIDKVDIISVKSKSKRLSYLWVIYK